MASDSSVAGFLLLLPLRPESPAVAGVVVDLQADDLAPRAARRAVRDVLGRSGASEDDLATAQLVVSELVTNVVRHGGPTMRLVIVRHESGARIEVTDHGGGLVARRPTVQYLPGGRGLRVVQALAHSWGVAERLDAKTVWCEILIPHPDGATASDEAVTGPDP